VSRPRIDLLGRSAAQSVRLIALRCLDEAAAASERLKDANDSEALHDFRVALRRLRTTLRVYRPLLEGSVPRRLRRRLREVADTTNQARDAEVALAWLRPLTEQLSPRERVGLHWLVERIERGRAKDLPRALASARRSFAGVERKLRKGLAVYRRTVTVRGATPEQRFGSIASAALLKQAKRLDQLIATVDGPDDDAVHQARIAAKRLRYQLEPLAEVLAGGADLVRRLRQLQDLLGELHDLVELEDEVRIALEAAAVARAGRLWELTLDDERGSHALRAARRRRQNPGLFAVAQRSRTGRAALFAQLKADWLGNTDVWAHQVEVAIAPLVTRPSQAAASRRPRRARTG
jgi:CHAD domain-containing protein